MVGCTVLHQAATNFFRLSFGYVVTKYVVMWIKLFPKDASLPAAYTNTPVHVNTLGHRHGPYSHSMKRLQSSHRVHRLVGIFAAIYAENEFDHCAMTACLDFTPLLEVLYTL